MFGAGDHKGRPYGSWNSTGWGFVPCQPVAYGFHICFSLAMAARRIVVLAPLAVALAGCASTTPTGDSRAEWLVDERALDDDWFCEPAEDGGWDCVQDSARVLPINSPDSSVAVSVQGQTEDVVGSVQGTGTALLEMDNVLLGDKITPGHFVVTSGLGSQIPRGILVGQIVEVRDRADIITRSADVRPAVNNDELKQVLVVLAEVESQ